MKPSMCRAFAAFAAASSLVLGGTVAAVAAPVPAGTVLQATASGNSIHTAAGSALAASVPAQISAIATAPTALATALPAVVTPKLAIQTIPNRTIRLNGTATIVPKATVSGAVAVSSRTVTVVQGRKTLVRSKSSARLKAGSYSVTTTVKYRTYTGTGTARKYSATKTATKKQKLGIVSAVAFKTIAGKTAPYGGKATIRPAASVAKGVHHVSTRLSVKQGEKTVASNKTSVALKAGTYRTTTSVKYRLPVYTTSTVKQTRNELVANPDKAAKMTCTVVELAPAEEMPDEGILPLRLTCTGPFDGKYETYAGYFTDTEENRNNDLVGFVLWLDNWDSTTSIKPVVGAKASPSLFPEKALYKKVTTSKTVTKKSWSGTYTATKTQNLRISAGKKPVRVAGTGGYSCPAGYPVKGNADSMIYHVRGGAFYAKTKPEECFSTTAAARKAGYRASKR
jgi:hypothetical protein